MLKLFLIYCIPLTDVKKHPALPTTSWLTGVEWKIFQDFDYSCVADWHAALGVGPALGEVEPNAGHSYGSPQPCPWGHPLTNLTPNLWLLSNRAASTGYCLPFSLGWTHSATNITLATPPEDCSELLQACCQREAFWCFRALIVP